MTQGLRIEAATPDDLPRILEVEEGAYADPWPLESFQAELDHTWSTVLVGRSPDGTIVGHMVYWHAADEVQLQNIAVHREARGLGWGRALMNHLIGVAQGVGARVILIEVRRSNAPAIALYRSLDFQDAGVRRGYYRLGQEDALLLTRSLGESDGSEMSVT